MKAGQQVTPTLRLTRLLGKGGMGSVWLADHLTLGSQVAIKFMSIANLEDETLLQRFRTEAKAAAQIKHPHVAQVFDHGVTEEGVPYIVMEFLEGEDLKHTIRKQGPLPLGDVSRIITQAAKALGRAHSLGIVHRDIKPDNIFLCNIDGEIFVKLLDFGVAKIDQGSTMDGATTTGSMMGTPLYMSPEQLLSARTVNHKSDLWSLAVVAYFALTGRVPFGGETIGSLSVAVHLGIFPAPSTVRPDLPPAVDAWFARMLKRDPTERFESAREMADAFEAAAHGREPMLSLSVSGVGTLPGPTSSSQPASMPIPSYPPVLSQSTPSTTDSQNIVSMPQPTFAGTASDAGKRAAATKRQLLFAAIASGGAVLFVVLLIVAFSSGSDDAKDKQDVAAQPDKPVVQAVSGLPTPPVSTSAAPSDPVVQPIPSASASSKKSSEKSPRIVTPPPTTTKTTKSKDTIGF